VGSALGPCSRASTKATYSGSTCRACGQHGGTGASQSPCNVMRLAAATDGVELKVLLACQKLVPKGSGDGIVASQRC
jgi:hypothetical protein